MEPNPVLQLFERYKSGDADAYWLIMLNQNVRNVFSNQERIISRAYAFTSEEQEDYRQEMMISFRDRLSSYVVDASKDKDHQANALFKYMQLALRGESEKIAKYTKGMTTRDDRGYSSIKGYKLGIDNLSADVAQLPDNRPDPSLRTDDRLKWLFNYFMDYGQGDFYRKLILHYQDGLSWNEIARRFQMKPAEKLSCARDANCVVGLIRFHMYVSDIETNFTILGIYTDEAGVGMAVVNRHQAAIKTWYSDNLFHDDNEKIVSKASDFIRIHKITWVIMNSVDRDNKGDTLLSQLIERRGYNTTRFDFNDLARRVPNYDRLQACFKHRHEGNAFMLACARVAQLNIIKRKA